MYHKNEYYYKVRIYFNQWYQLKDKDNKANLLSFTINRKLKYKKKTIKPLSSVIAFTYKKTF